jgi:hypothetical protein
MKTRQEMIYDFMIALCADLEYVRSQTVSAQEGADLIFAYAGYLADKYLGNQA